MKLQAYTFFLSLSLSVCLSVCLSLSFSPQQLFTPNLLNKYLAHHDNCTNCNLFILHILQVLFKFCSVLSKLHKVQNVAVRILTRRRYVHDISPVLIDIHWLPIPLRICYKINLLTFKCLHELGPPYLKNLLPPYQPERNLRSATKELLEENGYKLETYGRRAYFVVGPSFWNDLLVNLRFEDDLTFFKSSLKTHLFTLFTKNPDSYIY